MSSKAKGLRKFEEFVHTDVSSAESEDQVDELAGDIAMELDEEESQRPGYRRNRKRVNGGRNSSHDSLDESKNEDEGEDGTDIEKKNNIYTVESIVDHRLKRGELEYLIKWHGYTEDENTWEKHNQLYCDDLIQDYWDRKENSIQDKERWRTLPNKEKAQLTTRSPRKRTRVRQKGATKITPTGKTLSHRTSLRLETPSNAKTDESDTEVTTNKTSRKSTNFAHDTSVDSASGSSPDGKRKRPTDDEELPSAHFTTEEDGGEKFDPKDISGSWEKHVKEVSTVQRGSDGLVVFLVWHNGNTTQHSNKVANAKCPMKVIEFYEKRLQFSAPKKVAKKESHEKQ